MGNHIPSSALLTTNWNVNTTLNAILLKVFIDWCFGFDLSKCEPNVLNKLKKEIDNQIDLPIFKIKKKEANNGLNILDLVVRTKLLNSKSEVRRAIKDRGIKINDRPIQNDNYLISSTDFKSKINLFKLSHGKKNHVIIKLIN